MCDIMEADQDHTMTNSTNKYVNSDGKFYLGVGPINITIACDVFVDDC